MRNFMALAFTSAALLVGCGSGQDNPHSFSENPEGPFAGSQDPGPFAGLGAPIGKGSADPSGGVGGGSSNAGSGSAGAGGNAASSNAASSSSGGGVSAVCMQAYNCCLAYAQAQMQDSKNCDGLMSGMAKDSDCQSLVTALMMYCP
jgi:hypothetical protein